METIIEKKAFKKGIRDVDAISESLGKKLRSELTIGLGLRTRGAFSLRANGYVTHTPFEADKIEATFKEFGSDQPWGL